MEKVQNKKNMSIRKIVIITFIISMLVSSSFIGNMVFSNWISSIKEITQNLSKDINKEISSQVNTYLTIPKHINEVNEKFIENGIVDLSNENEMDKYFVGVLKTHKKEIYSFSYGMENGEYYGARRNEYDEIEIIRNNSKTAGSSWYYSVNKDLTSGEVVMKTDRFDARTRDWYIAAKAARKPTFSKIYKHFVMDDLTVSAATPIYNSQGELQGVLGSHMVLSNINDYLHKTMKEYGGYALVMEKNSNLLIANSFDNDNFVILDDGTLKRNQISELDSKLMTEIFDQYRMLQEDNFRFIYEERGYYVTVLPYQNEGLDWVIISAIPDNLFTQEIYQKMGITIIIILISILLVSLIYLSVIKWIFKPIDDLILASKQIAMGNLSKRAMVVRNDEIGKLSNAFNFMADKMYQFVNNLEEIVKARTTELELANEEINKTKEDLFLILDSTAEGILGIDMEVKLIFCNDSCLKLLGYRCQEDIIGKNMHHLIQHSYCDGSSMPQDDSQIQKSLFAGEKLYANNEVFWKEDGTKMKVEYHSSPKLKDGIVIGAVITFIDITEKKKDEEQIKYLNSHDFLTGLINRRCFESNLKEKDKTSLLPISIIFGDINGLKLMNDIFGHTAGDKLIQKVADVLTRVCRKEDIIARVGGDEFIILLPQTDAVYTKKTIDRIKLEVSKESINAVRLSIALGFDTKTNQLQNIEKIMGNAESEMYREKIISKKNYGIDTIETILKTLHERNPREKLHSDRVALLCEEMGRTIGLSETQIKRLRDAGYLHDIGKIVLDEEILKNGNLNESANQQKQQHPVVGYRILNLFDDTLDLADGVYAHHEKWDGTGYPKGLKGQEIPLIARIIAIVERYENRMVEMENIHANSKMQVLNELKELSGKDFDPKLTDVFITLLMKKDESANL